MELSKERIVAKSIAFTLYQLKVKEYGSNKGEVVERILLDANGEGGQPWCAATADWIYEKTCLMLGMKPIFDIGLSSSRFVSLAKKANKIVTAEQVQDADFVVFKGNAYGTGYIHTGFVWTPVDAEGNYYTIEGNKGNTVAKVYRNTKTSPCVFIRLFD